LDFSKLQISNQLHHDINLPSPESNPNPDPDPAQEKGWCFIGKNKDKLNVCSYVGVNDKCMSGDIFPTKEICINPKLR
jgi:hypothetical protein